MQMALGKKKKKISKKESLLHVQRPWGISKKEMLFFSPDNSSNKSGFFKSRYSIQNDSAEMDERMRDGAWRNTP